MTKENPKIHHEKTITIAWGDMDALGHVNNIRYFEYFQQARIDWLDSMNLPMNSQQGPVLLQIGCTYFRPIVYPATLSLKSHIHSPGRSSLRMDHGLYQDGEHMAQAESKIVWVDYQRNKSIPLPDVIRAFFD